MLLDEINQEEKMGEFLNEIDDINKQEALRYIVMSSEEDILRIINIYETCSISPNLTDFIELLNKFLKIKKFKKKIDFFRWEIFCIDREIPNIEKELKENTFKVVTT